MFPDLKNTKSILTWLICLAYTGLFFPLIVSNLTLFVLLAFALVKTKPRELLATIKENAFSKIILALYFVQVLGLLYTSNFKVGLFLLEKKASLLLIPLFVLPLLQKSNADIQLLFRRIGLITLSSSVMLVLLATFNKYILHDSQAFFYERFTSIHYVYYAIYFACGSLFFIDAWYDSLIKKKYGVLILILLFTYSLGVMIFVASKTGIMAFALASVVLLYKKIPNKKLFSLTVASLVVVASGLFYFNPTARSRFTGLDKHLSFLTLDDWRDTEIIVTDLNMRLVFWKISIVNLWRDHLIFTGVGTGDAQDYINNLYALPQYQLYGFINWDSHNQWIFALIQLGLVGIGVLLLLFGKYFLMALAQNDFKLLCFLIVTLAFSLSESILESNKGIVFFAILFTCLAAAYRKNSPVSVV